MVDRPDPGYGPPVGHPFERAPSYPMDQVREQIERRVGGGAVPTLDPAFAPPTSPLGPGSKQRASLVYRDVPLVTIQTSWTVDQIRTALFQHMYGLFDMSGQLVDAIMGDDRVQATLGSRTAGLFGREARIEPAKKRRVRGSSAAKECYEAWLDHWPSLDESTGLVESHAYAIFQGVAHGQVVWDTSESIWLPYPKPWHPRYTYYEWSTRKYVAISQDGQYPIFAGDGKFYEHAPYGSYRGWVRGALRAVAEPWIIRKFAIRDWAGFSEIHGFPTRKGFVPAAADPGERSQFERQIASLGSNTSMIVPRGVDKDMGYDYELVEAGDTAWESFPGLRDHCDLAIILALRFQNLTTSITSGGSYAAAREHGRVDLEQIKSDNTAWKRTLYRDFARPFAFINFGDADLAPMTEWDVPEPPREDYNMNAELFNKFGTALEVMRRGGLEFLETDELRRFAREHFGLDGLPDFRITEPVSSGGGGSGGFGK